ncbi:hypothetical protein EVAR_51366_1 [Eumeta japonica]|uniref:Uncharacterized protein n=1 Tax=Eumeta variegata TaxID=151549 RepID=A0A4C1Y2X0_EUMVA|nr:hypothetical protein EVAR_51366_1 [Eumeta japonica]
MGLRPVVDVSHSSRFAICLSHFHSGQVALLMCLGYVLQYMACFRCDFKSTPGDTQASFATDWRPSKYFSQHALTTTRRCALDTDVELLKNSDSVREVIPNVTENAPSDVLIRKKSDVRSTCIRSSSSADVRHDKMNSNHMRGLELNICAKYLPAGVNNFVAEQFLRDRGFCYKLVPLAKASTLEYETYKQICYGNITFIYIGPSVLHFIGFLYALYLFRISDNEQLQNLMERVFLLSSFPPQGMPVANPRRLLRTLWFFILLSVLWMCLSLGSINIMMAEGTIMFRWMEWR